AGAWLDTPPDFPDETWAEWEAEKREQFGTHWPRVQAVLEALDALRIHMVDVSPSNIAFLDSADGSHTWEATRSTLPAATTVGDASYVEQNRSVPAIVELARAVNVE